ncbi:MAG: Cu(I)-responsive transcriptional regulator [Alphaproteobacteria bacterium]
MNIGEAAKASGVPAKTIRYYESVNLIPPAQRTGSGYRTYGGDDIARLRFIQRSRSLGFSVRDVAMLLDLWGNRARASAEVKALVTSHIDEIDCKIAELRSMRQTLQDLSDRCHGDDRPDCPILDSLAGG